jgi:hemolysin III
MTSAIRDPIPQTWAARPPCLSGRGQSPRFRGWIHAGAAVAALPAGAALVDRAAATGSAGFVAFYAGALVVLYSVSAAYHLMPVAHQARYWLRRADHASIYVFIGACYTPYCGLVVRGELGAVVLALVWAGVLAGVTMKLARFERLGSVGGLLYLGLGWLALVTVPAAASRLSLLDVGLLVSMGFTYTIGAAVLALRRPDPLPQVFGYHEVWHSLVVLAGACYFAIVWTMVAAPR